MRMKRGVTLMKQRNRKHDLKIRPERILYTRPTHHARGKFDNHLRHDFFSHFLANRFLFFFLVTKGGEAFPHTPLGESFPSRKAFLAPSSPKANQRICNESAHAQPWNSLSSSRNWIVLLPDAGLAKLAILGRGKGSRLIH